MKHPPKISVIIPVNNSEAYLNECLDSLLKQTLEEIEIICVDDGSTDCSPEIIRAYMQQDGRVQGIFLSPQQSAQVARIRGVKASAGAYVLFLDSDDWLEPEACAALYEIIMAEQVDILHFRSRVENCARIPAARVEMNQRLIEPYAGRLTGPEVFRACFVKKKYAFTLWNKLFRGDLCRRAFAAMEERYLPKAQDLYAYFVLAHLAESYLGWAGPVYHHYCFGRGVTGSKMTLKTYERYCFQADVAEALRRFCQAQQLDTEENRAVIDGLASQWLKESLQHWLTLSEPRTAAQVTEILFAHWDSAVVLARLTEQYWYEQEYIADKLGKLPGTSLRDKKIKTIALYYYRYTIGGLQRVVSLMMPLYQSMGYRVVLITDSAPSEDDYPLPEGVERCLIFDWEQTKADNYASRAAGWEALVREKDIDLVIYHAWTSPLFLWDMVFLKTHDVPVVLQAHSVFSYSLLRLGKEFYGLPHVVALADAMSVLSEMDRAFWSAFNPQVYVMPNPVAPELRQVPQSGGTEPIITWIGRFSYEKQPEEAVWIMEKVAAAMPEARLYMIGGETAGSGLMEKCEELVREKGLENQVQFLGLQPDVSPFLARAAVNLITSSYEGYSMVLVEAQAHGVPAVTYDLSYLSLAQPEYGVVNVPPGNHQAAADEILRLLLEPSHWQEQHRLALNSFRRLTEFDLKGAWQKILNGAPAEPVLPPAAKEMLSVLTSHYSLGWQKTHQMPVTLPRGQLPLVFRPLNKIIGGLYCWQEHGFSYTVRLGIEKMKRLIRG